VWGQIIRHQESMGFYKFFIVQSTLSEPVSKKEKMHKNCTHHHVVIGAVNFLKACSTNILVLAGQQHQYIGAIQG
jgi:hypothetical protein